MEDKKGEAGWRGGGTIVTPPLAGYHGAWQTLSPMGGSPKTALGAGSTGCSICDTWNDTMITVVDHSARICRPCATRVGRAILAATPSVLAQLWPQGSSEREARPAASTHTDVNFETAFAAFKEGVAKQISFNDAQSHYDLAVAYDEMGLVADAVREAAIALGEGAPLSLADHAINWIFAIGRADGGALRKIIDGLRDEHSRPS